MALGHKTLNALAACLFLLLAACDSPAEREAAHVARGKELLAAGDPVKAALEFRNALQINPVGAEATFMLAKIAEDAGDYLAALRGYRAVADQNAGNLDAQLKAGRLELYSGDPLSAIYRAEKVLSTAPTQLEARTLKAGALRLEGKLDQASKELDAVLAQDANHADALGLLAEIKLAQGKAAEAATLVDRGLQAVPGSIELTTLRLTIYRRQQDKDGIYAMLKKLVALQPDNPEYLANYAGERADEGDLLGAKALFEDAIAKNRGGEAIIARYAAFLEQRVGLDGAYQELMTPVAGASPGPAQKLLLAQLCLRSGALDKAEAAFEDVVSSAPKVSQRHEAQAGLAQLALLRHDNAAAEAIVAAILQEDAHQQGALLIRAGLRLAAQKFDAAIADLRMVLHGDPDQPTALSLLARGYMAQGDRELAGQTLRQLLEVDPRDVQAHLDMASLLAARAPAEALEHLDAAIALKPHASEILAQKALYLVTLGKPDMAELIGRDIIKADAKDPLGHQVLGEAAAARKDETIALGAFISALDNGGDFKVLGPKIVQAYVDGGKLADAIAFLSQRLTRDPDDATSLVLLATLRQGVGDGGDAIQLLDRAMAVAPGEPAAYLVKARLLGAAGRYSDSAQVMAIATAKMPGNVDVALAAAAALEASGDVDAARVGYERVLALAPNNLVAINNLATLIADSWAEDSVRLSQARNLAERFRASNNATQLDTLGWVLTRQGQFDDALPVLARAVALQPDNQGIQYHYAVALDGKGLGDKARAAITLAIQGEPRFRGVADARRLAERIR
ncbi:tetratricopeptide repeat protein [Dongia rigui]|uniref:Tetratricopeptide repeat protein n=1 Tax=Dongia rigui TaxID=940149 RepID=A0ABU5DTI6_9PROT|nr:tetratricopeptide repeat protein [Dongia rigui]MDY0870627.1 tetratricopeptide repeat protein [Dongia rigui]